MHLQFLRLTDNSISLNIKSHVIFFFNASVSVRSEDFHIQGLEGLLSYLSYLLLDITC